MADQETGGILKTETLQSIYQRNNIDAFLVVGLFIPISAGGAPAAATGGDNEQPGLEGAEAKADPKPIASTDRQADAPAGGDKPAPSPAEASPSLLDPEAQQGIAAASSVLDGIINITSTLSKESVPLAPISTAIAPLAGVSSIVNTLFGKDDAPKSIQEAVEQGKALQAQKKAEAEAKAAQAAKAETTEGAEAKAGAAQSAGGAPSSGGNAGASTPQEAKAEIAAKASIGAAAAAAAATPLAGKPDTATPQDTPLKNALARPQEADASSEKPSEQPGQPQQAEPVIKLSLLDPIVQNSTISASSSVDGLISFVNTLTKEAAPLAPISTAFAPLAGVGSIVNTLFGKDDAPKSIQEAVEQGKALQAKKKAEAEAKAAEEKKAAEAQKAAEAAADPKVKQPDRTDGPSLPEQLLTKLDERLAEILTLLKESASLSQASSSGMLRPLSEELGRLIFEAASNEYDRRGWY